jgi:hypothetical protein
MSKFTIALAVVAVAAVARAEAPQGKTAEQQFKNITVFKGVPASQIDPAMDVISAALGVRCNHCHVKADKGPWAFEKDDKAAKRTARKMVTMMAKINHDFFGDNQVVTCATCHNGHAEPRSIPPMELAQNAAPPEAEKAPPPKKAAPPATVKQLLDKWVQASGGAAAWGKLKTRTVKAEVAGFGPQPMPVEIQAAAPDRWHAKLTTPNGVFDQVYDGKHGWHSFGGQSESDDSPDIVREAQFAPPLTLPKLLKDLKVAPDAPLPKGNAHILEGRMGELRVKLWLDAQTGLLSRVAVREPTPAGDLPFDIDYEDYRTVDGVKLPFVAKTNKGGNQSVETDSEIKHNVTVDNAQFAAPAKEPATPPAK